MGDALDIIVKEDYNIANNKRKLFKHAENDSADVWRKEWYARSLWNGLW